MNETPARILQACFRQQGERAQFAGMEDVEGGIGAHIEQE